MPSCDGAGTAKRSYPSSRSGAAAGRSYPESQVSGSREETHCVQGQWQWPRGATLRPRPGATSKARGGIQGQWRPGGDNSHPRPRAVAERSYSTTEVGAARRSHLAPKARGGGPEEAPHAGGQGRHPRPGAAAGRTNLRSSAWAGIGGPRGAIPC